MSNRASHRKLEKRQRSRGAPNVQAWLRSRCYWHGPPIDDSDVLCSCPRCRLGRGEAVELGELEGATSLRCRWEAGGDLRAAADEREAALAAVPSWDLRSYAKWERQDAADKDRGRRRRRWRPVKLFAGLAVVVLLLWLTAQFDREHPRTPQEVRQYEQYENLGAEK
jgi:hypothetical protein